MGLSHLIEWDIHTSKIGVILPPNIVGLWRQSCPTKFGGILPPHFLQCIAVLLEVDLKHLPRLMLSLPHVTSSCNASAEYYIFSMVKAIKTDSLHNSTLSALSEF